MASNQNHQEIAALTSVIRQGRRADVIAALHRIGEMDDRQGVPALLAALRRADRGVRAVAAGKLVFLNTRATVPHLVRSLADPESRVRQHAIYALQKMRARRAAPRIARLLAVDKNPVTRLNAVQALQVLGSVRERRVLVAALSDPHADIVLAACAALTRIVPREAVRLIVRLAADDRRWARIPDVQRDHVLRFLKNALTQIPVRMILRRRLDGGMQRLRTGRVRSIQMETAEIASLLAAAGDPAAVPALLECLKGGEYMQERALIGLAQVKARDPQVVRAVLDRAWKNEFYPVKLRTVRTLAVIGDSQALPALAGVFDRTTTADFPVTGSTVFTKDDPELTTAALEAIRQITMREYQRLVRQPHHSTRKARKS